MQFAKPSSSTDVDLASGRPFFDLAVAALALVFLSPLLLLIAALVRFTSPGPILHRAERVGKAGRPFRLYKFRTMAAEAAHTGPGITRAGDLRITPLGHWLRNFKLDELPQLFNVLKGEMSLVGPRPEDPRYVARYTPEQRRVLAWKPGITGAASVRYRNEEALLTGEDWEQTYCTVILPHKLHIELGYLEHRTFASDLLILWQTFLTLLR